MSTVETCPHCGQAIQILFRKWAIHWKTGKKIFPARGKVLAIRICGCTK